MRWLIFGAGLTLLGFTSAANAQDRPIPPLERLIDVSYEIRVPAHECTVPSAVLGLVRRYEFIAGVEYPLVDCQRQGAGARRDGERINLQGLSVRDALHKLTEIDPSYRWIERNGLVVLRPLEAWGDPNHMLNFKSESFVLDEVNVGSALNAVVEALTGKPRSSLELHRSAERTEQGARRFSVKTGPTSVGEALDSIVRAHGQAWWQFGGGPSRGPAVYIHTFDGTGLGISTMPRH